MSKKKKKTLQEIFEMFPTKVHLYDGSQPLHPKDKPKKQKLFFGCNYKDQPTICFQWSEKGRGFGEYTFWEENGQIYCDNEMDTKETVMRVLCTMVQQSKFGETWETRRNKKCSALS